MEFNLIGYENGKEVKVPIPFDEIVKQFWPYHNAPRKHRIRRRRNRLLRL